jgi:hypothetical protein
MAKKRASGTSFAFGANVRKKSKAGKAKKAKGSGKKSNSWRAYVSNKPIPD